MAEKRISKLRVEINKCLKTVCNCTKPTSELKLLLEPSLKDVFFDRADRIHCTL